MPVAQAMDPAEFMKKVSDYFEPYRCLTGTGSRQKALSYVLCKSCEMRDENDSQAIVGNMVADFEIKYFFTDKNSRFSPQL
jgi:hypothetical protein